VGEAPREAAASGPAVEGGGAGPPLGAVAVTDVGERTAVHVRPRREHVEPPPEVDDRLDERPVVGLRVLEELETLPPRRRPYPGVVDQQRDGAGPGVELRLGEELGAVPRPPVPEDKARVRPRAGGRYQVSRHPAALRARV